MPVFNLTRILEFTLRLSLFSTFIYFFLTSMNDFTSLLISIIGHFSGSSSSSTAVTGLNIGCVAEKIGLVTFLNSLFIVVYNGVGLYISSVMSIIVFKWTTKAYSFVFKI